MNYLQTKITKDILLAWASERHNADQIIAEVNSEMLETPIADNPLPSAIAMQENLELVLYAVRVPAVAKLLKDFLKLGIAIVQSDFYPVPVAKRTGNMSLCYHLEDGVKRLLLACRAGNFVSWDIGKVFNHRALSPMDEIIGDVYAGARAYEFVDTQRFA